MKKRLLIIAGTYDGRMLIEKFKNLDIDIFVTVATENGKSILEDKDIEIIDKRLDYEEFKSLILAKNINVVVDASHPYAQVVTKTIKKVCSDLATPIIRYLRPEDNIYEIVKSSNILSCDSKFNIYKNNIDDFISENIILVENSLEAANYLNTTTSNILLTTGSKDLNIFVDNISDYKNRLYVRVLPVTDSIKKCENLNISFKNIIALSGNFTVDFNKEMIKFCNANIVVTKDSGDVGGFRQKLVAALELSCKVVVIKRPVEDSNYVSNYEDVYKNVMKIFS